MRIKDRLKYEKRSAELADLSFVDRILYWDRDNPMSMDTYDAHTFEELKNKTNFLPNDANRRQRIWHILNDNYDIQTCKLLNCKNPVKWNYEKRCYNSFCSSKCRASDPSMIEVLQSQSAKEKRTQTNITRYGGTTPSASNVIVDKIKNTNIQRYGVGSVLALTDKRNNHLEEYGVSNVSQLQHIKDKKRLTMQQRYGVDNVFEMPHVASMRQSNSELLCSQEVNDKKRKTNMERYGVNSPTQRHITPENLQLLNNEEWLLDKHYNEKLNCAIIAKMIGVDRHTVANKIKDFGHNLKRYYRSGPEIEIYDIINQLVPALHNVRNIINKELDIFVPSLNIAIEYCGLYWHSEERLDKNYHHEKYNECKKVGVRLIQIFEDEWMEHRDLVLQKIQHILKHSVKQKVFARKCKMVGVSLEDKKIFFNKFHLQSDGPSSVNFGLTYEEQLVAVAGFIQKKDGGYILNRYATSINVVGGFSKIIKNLPFSYEYIETFADLRWSSGDLYLNNGFVESSFIKPDYAYCKGERRFHKFGFRHSHLKNKLKNYDETLTEYENCLLHNYYRIWDAGKLKFILKP